MTPVESVGHPQYPREPPHDGLLVFGQPRELLMLHARALPAVIPAHQRHQVPVPAGEVEPLSVHDELKAVLVVLPVAHHLPHVVHRRSNPRAVLAGRQPEQRAQRGQHEDRERAAQGDERDRVGHFFLACIGERFDRGNRRRTADAVAGGHQQAE